MPALIPTPKHLSPIMLAQEFVRNEPWQLLAICILLNRTNGVKQVKPMLADFFDAYPTPAALIDAPIERVKVALKPLGFQNIRYDRLVHMSRDWLSGKRPPNDKLRGVGVYGKESYEIFVLGYLLLEPHDKELKRYVRWAQEEWSAGGHGLHHDGSGGIQPGVQAPQRDAALEGGASVGEEVPATVEADIEEPR
jgi:methyl-CpG-binding domain protein 4